jgi:hypothetical protein
MQSRSRRQLVLALEEEIRPVTLTPEGLVEALADLLLEAIGQQEKQASAKGGVDESEDHG